MAVQQHVKAFSNSKHSIPLQQSYPVIILFYQKALYCLVLHNFVALIVLFLSCNPQLIFLYLLLCKKIKTFIFRTLLHVFKSTFRQSGLVKRTHSTLRLNKISVLSHNYLVLQGVCLLQYAEDTVISDGKYLTATFCI